MSENTGAENEIRAWALEHHIPQAAIDRWLRLNAVDALAILAAVRELRLRTGQFLNALDMLIETSVRQGEGAAAILMRRDLQAIIRGGGSRPERATAFVDKLRELRYPRLTRTREKLESAIATMRLPRGLTMVLPRDLGSDELVIRMTLHSAADFEQQLAALADRTQKIKAVIEALGGSPENRIE